MIEPIKRTPENVELRGPAPNGYIFMCPKCKRLKISGKWLRLLYRERYKGRTILIKCLDYPNCKKEHS